MDSRLRKYPLGYWEIERKPIPKELQKYYADKYYQDGNGSYEQEYSFDESSYFNAKLEQRWEVLKHQLLLTIKGVSRLLDEGCSEGFALAFFREALTEIQGLRQ